MPYNYKTELGKYRKYYQSLEPWLEKPHYRSYTTVVFSFLAVSLFGWYAIRPTIQTILFLKREIADKTELNKQMEQKITALIEAQALYQQLEPAIPAINQALPMDPQPIELVVQLRNLASLSGVLLSTVQVPTVPLTGSEATAGGSAKKPPGAQAEVPLSLSVQGAYDQVRGFITGVTFMRRVATVDGMTVEHMQTFETSATPSATPMAAQLQLVLKLKGYYVTK